MGLYRRAIVMRTESVYGPRVSWVAIGVFFAPIVLLGYDVPRRYGEVQRRTTPPIVRVICTIEARDERRGPPELERVCPCTGAGDPLCSEIPGQTCRLER
jgi:hypothetical protein